MTATDSEQRIRIGLRRCSAFADLPAQSLDPLVGGSELRQVPRRGRLYERGDSADGVFALSTGRVRLVRGVDGSRMVTVDYRGAGQLLGESCLGTDGHRPDTALALEVTEAVHVPLGVMREALAAHPELSARLTAIVVDRSAASEGRIESLLSRAVEARVAEFLLQMAAVHGVPDSRGTLIGVKYTHQEIANYVGSTRETVTLTLGDFRRRGHLAFDHRRIVITDIDSLRALL